MLAGISRRIEPLLLKLGGRLPTCPWRSVFFYLNPRTVGVRPPPMRIEVVEEDGISKRLRFNGMHEVWFPASTNVNLELWNEYLSVFSTQVTNAHYYVTPETPVKPGDVVIDCGACEGFFAQQALGLGAARVICVEPNAELVRCLEKTFAAEIRKGAVSVRPVALGAFRGETCFGFDAAYPSSGQIGAGANPRKVAIERLADVCDELGLATVDFIKMDLEGAEIQAVEGALSLPLMKCHPKLAITTYHRAFDFVCLKSVLRSAGYRHFRAVGVAEFGQRRCYRPVMLHAWK